MITTIRVDLWLSGGDDLPCVLKAYHNSIHVVPVQVVILRHSLFALADRDVMVAGFLTVSSVTVVVLAAIVGMVTALMMAGVAQVINCQNAVPGTSRRTVSSATHLILCREAVRSFFCVFIANGWGNKIPSLAPYQLRHMCTARHYQDGLAERKIRRFTFPRARQLFPVFPCLPCLFFNVGRTFRLHFRPYGRDYRFSYRLHPSCAYLLASNEGYGRGR